MAGTSAYPGSVDSFTDNTDWTGDPNAAPASARITASDVNNLQASVQAIETTVGVNPQGAAATVAARIAAIETGGAPAVAGITTAWATGTTYAAGDTVTSSGYTYLCRSAHTSGVFATDLTNNRWVALDAAGSATAAAAGTAAAAAAQTAAIGAATGLAIVFGA